MAIRILIAVAQSTLRMTLRALVARQQDLEVVGDTGDVEELPCLAAAARPALVLLDISLLCPHALETTRQLANSICGAQLLLLSDYGDTDLIRESLAAGAAGLVLIGQADSTLDIAIRTVAQGQLYIEPIMVRALLAELLPRPDPHDEGMAALTPREAEVLRLIAEGFTNRQVAQQLHLSVRTVESHRANIMSKLCLQGRADLVRFAMARHLIEVAR